MVALDTARLAAFCALVERMALTAEEVTDGDVLEDGVDYTRVSNASMTDLRDIVAEYRLFIAGQPSERPCEPQEALLP